MNRKGCPVIPSMTLGLLLLSLTPLLRAQDAPDNQTLTPYGAALLDYKTDRYKDALTAINEAENEKPGEPPTHPTNAGPYTGRTPTTIGPGAHPQRPPKTAQRP